MGRVERKHTGASPAAWAVPAALFCVVAGLTLLSQIFGPFDILWQPVDDVLEQFQHVEPRWQAAAFLLPLGLLLPMVGLRMRGLLRAFGEHDSLPDLAAVGGLLAGGAAAVAAVVSWVAHLVDRTAHIDAAQDALAPSVLVLLALGLWLYPTAVGLGVVTAVAAWRLRDENLIDGVRAGLGGAAAVIALVSPVSIIFGHLVALAVIGQLATLAWLVVVPRDL
ncbi:hypothetical protein ACPYO6_13955 [Georgenia sp. Z1344]|uniref:hypothetical protein n=1 Tax=Georgenia sp. Z1344 TaxID=3416706 RepID=UPI003CEF59FE